MEPTENQSPPTRAAGYASQELSRLAGAVREINHPTQIGPFHILEPIGEGGMGTVYKAQQSSPIHRTVAIKVIKPGMDTRDVIARFEAERQALALMDHPNVARVIDAGATDDQRPYFVMEFVDGEPITSFSDQEKLTLEQRLELFVQACQAVQHAHQKAIIHRDLKPSNILAGRQDGKPWVKVIDFGVAKAIDQRLTEKTLFTQTGQFIGTLEYMSPEQADSGGVDVDTRSDVYSLGIVLYELLTGTLPFDAVKLRTAGFAEIQRIIREEDPPRPSTRLSRLGEMGPQIAAARQLALEALEQKLHRELDWIPLKAIRKDRAQRYATATELADDIDNYLNRRPLRAGPESAAYRARKFVARNWRGVAASAAMVLLLIGGIITTTWQAIRATHAQRETTRALHEVELQKIQTDQANNSLSAVNAFLTQDVLGASKPEFTHGKAVTVTDALDSAARTISSQFKDHPETAISVRLALATAYRALGRSDLGMPHAQAALELSRQSLAPEHPSTLASMSEVAAQLGAQGKYDDAERTIRDVLQRAERAFGPNHPLTIDAVAALAEVLHARGKFADAEPLCRRALDARRKLLGESHRDTLASLSALANLLADQGKFADAEPIFRQTLELSRQLLGDDHPQTLTTLSQLGQLLRELRKPQDAEPLFTEALNTSRRVLGEDHPQTIECVTNVGDLYVELGRHNEAEPLLRQAVQRSARASGVDHPDTLNAMSNLARLLYLMRRDTEAEALYRDALERARRTLGPEHPGTLALLNNLTVALAERHRFTEAEPMYREVLAGSRHTFGEDHPKTLNYQTNLADLLRMQGKFPEAETLFRDTLAKQRRLLGDDHPKTLFTLMGLGKVLQQQQRLDEAEAAFAELYRRSESAQAQVDPRETAFQMSFWGICLSRMHRYTDAEAPLLEAHRRLMETGLEKNFQSRLVVAALAEVCDHTNRPTEAVKWRDELRALEASTRPATQTTQPPAASSR